MAQLPLTDKRCLVYARTAKASRNWAVYVLHGEGMSKRWLARRFGVSRQRIQQIVLREELRHDAIDQLRGGRL